MKLKNLISEDKISATKREFDKGKEYNDFLVKTAKQYNVNENYIKLYNEVTTAFGFLTWLEMYHDVEPGSMPDEQYEKQKKEYSDKLNGYAARKF